MPNHVAVIFVHGINVDKANYSVPMRTRLIKGLSEDSRKYVTFREVFWADLLRGRQDDYLLSARSSTSFKDTLWRRFVVQGLGDAAAYQKTKRRANSAYFQIQGRISETLDELDNPELPERPLILIGHSLGCHILSSFIWDINRSKQMTVEERRRDPDKELVDESKNLEMRTPFRRLETLSGFVTMGSNMPLFTFTFGPHNVYPITRSPNNDKKAAFPGTRLEGKVQNLSKWLNFYSKNDLLGYPLKPLNKSYMEEPRLIDVAVKAEGFFRSLWLHPLNAIAAHTGYWTNPTVIMKTSNLIEEAVNLDQ